MEALRVRILLLDRACFEEDKQHSPRGKQKGCFQVTSPKLSAIRIHICFGSSYITAPRVKRGHGGVRT